jgi:hypothetical protein
MQRMPPTITITLDDLDSLQTWVSVNDLEATSAYISKTTGELHFTPFDGEGEEPPDNVTDETRYWTVPRAEELGLGHGLVFRYVRESLPDDFEAVQDFFRRRGAYARFKDLLDRRGHLNRWKEYENRATQDAYVQWALDSGMQIIDATGIPVTPARLPGSFEATHDDSE